MNIDTQSFYGHFDSWEQAMKMVPSRGYENPNIIKKVIEATECVRRGEGAFESDGKCYKRTEYKYYLLCSLYLVVIKYGYLNILDYGGSLGSLYYRHREMLRFPYKWNIIEQKHYVDYGKSNIPEMDFFYNLEECFENNHDKPINCVLFAGSLEYLEYPYEILGRIIDEGINDIIIDTAQIGEMSSDWICNQKIPEEIYSNTEYPVWMLSKKKFEDFFTTHSYSVLNKWKHPWISEVNDSKDTIQVIEQGYHWERQNR